MSEMYPINVLTIVVEPTILTRFGDWLVWLATAEGVPLGKPIECPLVKVKGEEKGQPYGAGTIHRQVNDVLNGKAGRDIRKACPALKNLTLHRAGEDVFVVREK